MVLVHGVQYLLGLYIEFRNLTLIKLFEHVASEEPQLVTHLLALSELLLLLKLV